MPLISVVFYIRKTLTFVDYIGFIIEIFMFFGLLAADINISDRDLDKLSRRKVG